MITPPEGYLAQPVSGKGPGVLVLHPWWGLNDTIRDFCDRLSDAGFTAFAPDLYHGRLAVTIPEAEALSGALDGERAKAEILEAAAYLGGAASRPDRQLAVIGFSLGAYFALDLSSADPEHIRAVVLFYGTGPVDPGRSRAAYLGHFAETDPYESKEYVDGLEQALRAAGRPVTFHHYSGTGHWFFEPDRMDAYRPEAAALAWERTVSFLEDTLPSGE
jgi:carboxymethylenebutenolidase